MEVEMGRSHTGRREFLVGMSSLASLGPLAPAAARGDDRRAQGGLLSPAQRAEVAVMNFENGHHCAQAVLAAYADDHGLDPTLALRMGAALAGGSTVGGECGALVAGYLVLGMRHGLTRPTFGDVSQEEELFGRLRRLVAAFRERHGALTCRELLGVDVFTREGREEGHRRGLFRTRCPQHVRDVVDLLEALG
jgi:C_GCAxxG_C_C family probable redox protein